MVRDGKVLGVDFPAVRAELLERLRAGMAAMRTLAAALFDLERVLGPYFEAEPPCC